MPRMPGFLQSRSKKDQAEWDLVQSRTAARLAAMFREETGQEPPAEADEALIVPLDDDEAVSIDAPLESPPVTRWVGDRRPGIVVVGDADAPPAKPSRRRTRRVVQRGAGPNGWTVVDPSAREASVEPVPVMAPADDHEIDDVWRLPAEPATEPVAADLPADVAEIGAPPAPADVAEAPVPDMAAAPEVTSVAAIAESEVAEPPVARPPARRRSRARSRAVPPPPAPPAPVVLAHCPYCALLLEPAPTVSRRCDRCRQRIIVKRVDGQPVYLTEAAVQVFDAERRRLGNAARLTRERERWLRLAATAGAPAGRQARLAAARLTEDVVAAARSLYLTTVDRAFWSARRDHDWERASRIRRDQAMALYRLAGSPVPPPENVMAIFREGVAAELRGVAEISRDAELLSARCCDACRADDGRILRITTELRTPRLPHTGCPKGLCHCHWDLAARDRRTIRRYLQRRPGSGSRGASAAAVAAAPTETAPTA